MKRELLDHIKHCSRCHTLLKHVFVLRLVGHLVSQKFTEAEAHHAVRVIYGNLRKSLRKVEAQS